MKKNLLYIFVILLSPSSIYPMDDFVFFDEEDEKTSAKSPPLEEISNFENLGKFILETNDLRSIHESIIKKTNTLHESATSKLKEFYQKNNIENYSRYHDYLISLQVLTNDITKAINSIPESMKKFNKTVKMNTLNKLYETVLNYINKVTSNVTLIKKDLFKLKHFKDFSESKTKKINFEDGSLYPGFEYLADQEFIKDEALNNAIVDQKQMTDKGNLYIKFACYLLINIKISGTEDFLRANSLFTVLSAANAQSERSEQKTYVIKEWNLYHVFLGSLTNQDFGGVHSGTIIPNILTSDLYNSVSFLGSPNLDSRLIFYQTNNLRNPNNSDADYYVKVSTLFPQEMKIQDCMESVIKALKNIQLIIPFKETVLNIIGYDRDTKLIINISYDTTKQSVITFFPLFYAEQSDLSDKESLKLKYEEISTEFNFGITLSKKSYNEFIKEQKTPTKLTELKNQLLEIKRADDRSKRSPTPIMRSPKKISPSSAAANSGISTPLQVDRSSSAGAAPAAGAANSGISTPLQSNRSPSIPFSAFSPVSDVAKRSPSRASSTPQLEASADDIIKSLGELYFEFRKEQPLKNASTSAADGAAFATTAASAAGAIDN